MVVVPLKKGRGPIRHIKSPDEMDLEEVNGSEFSCRNTTFFHIYILKHKKMSNIQDPIFYY